ARPPGAIMLEEGANTPPPQARLTHMVSWLVRHAPVVLTGGLLTLTLAAAVGAATAQTGAALVGLGATALLARRTADGLLLTAHAVMYLGISALFVGAAWHGASGAGPGLLMVDLLAGVAISALLAPLVYAVASRGPEGWREA
ncbi:MAG: hypothetical protein AAGB00_11600, partial [Planctomycetota bacterium]